MPSPARRIIAKIAGRTIVGRVRYLQAKVKASRDRTTVVNEARALLNFLRRSGCTFHRCRTLIAAPTPKGIAYRYDIHVRDIPGARVLADFHLGESIPATFFLMWGYSPFERQHLEDYRVLRKLISDPLEIGLHDSPIDAFLIKSQFSDNRREYAKWANSERALEWLAALAADPKKLAKLNEAALEDFIARTRETRALFGPFSLVAGHGGELGQGLRSKLRSLPPDVLQMAESFRARYWLTPVRVAAAGLEFCTDKNRYSLPGWGEVSDNGGQIVDMARVLRDRLTKEQTAIQLLLHPYTWAGGKRDGELSDLLKIDA